MRVCVSHGRATVLTARGQVDIAEVSGGVFPADVAELYRRWEEFCGWSARQGFAESSGADPAGSVGTATADGSLGPVSPHPAQIFAIGLNYLDHAVESGFAVPSDPIVFTKFVSSLAGPYGDLVLSGDEVDWEIELVAVVGTGGSGIRAEDAWAHLAGVTIGQDYSDRAVQFRGEPSQFSLGKSFAGYAPIGPVLVTPDELADAAETVLECSINGEVVQSAPLSDLVFSIPDLVERLSSVVTLLPGDLIFTGTPPGVGFGRQPRRYLRAGDVVRSRITGIGEMEQVCVAAVEDGGVRG